MELNSEVAVRDERNKSKKVRGKGLTLISSVLNFVQLVISVPGLLSNAAIEFSLYSRCRKNFLDTNIVLSVLVDSEDERKAN